MRESVHYESGVVAVRPDDDVCKIVEEMCYYAVGCVIVVDERRAPVGIVTDRDLLRRVIRHARDPAKLRADAVMTADPVCGETDEPLERLLQKMKSAGVKRLPIVREGSVAGLVSLDDIVAEVGRELYDVRAALRSEVLDARRTAQRRRRRDEIAGTIEELRAQIAHMSSDSVDWLQREIDAIKTRLGGGG